MDHGPIEEQPEDERPRSPRPQGPDIEDPQSKASKAMTAVYAAGQDARDQKREAANAAGVKAALEVLAEKLKTPDGRRELGDLAAHETAAKTKDQSYFLARLVTTVKDTVKKAKESDETQSCVWSSDKMYLHEVGLIAVENALNDINIEDDTVKQQLERIVYALATVTVGLPGNLEAEKNIIPSYPCFLKNFKATAEYAFLVSAIIAAFIFAIQRKIGKGCVSKQQSTLCALFQCGSNNKIPIFGGALASPACARARDELEENGLMPSKGSVGTEIPMTLLAKATGVTSECAAERGELWRFEQMKSVMEGALDAFQNEPKVFDREALEDAVAKKGKGDHVIPRLLAKAKTITVVRKRHALAIIDGIDGVDDVAATAARNTINSLDEDSYVTIVRKKDVEAWETPLLVDDGRFPLLVDAEDAVEAFEAGGDNDALVSGAKTVLSFAVGKGVHLLSATARGHVSAKIDVEKTGHALFASVGATMDWRLVLTAGFCAAAFAVLMKKGEPGSVEREAIEAALVAIFASGNNRILLPSVLGFESCERACAIVPLPLDGGNTSAVQSKLIGEAAGNAHPDDIFKKLIEVKTSAGTSPPRHRYLISPQAKNYLMVTEIGNEVLERLLDGKLEEGRYEEAVRTASEDPKRKPSFWLHEACADAKLVEAGVDDAPSFQPPTGCRSSVHTSKR